jgi:NAD+ kinase
MTTQFATVALTGNYADERVRESIRILAAHLPTRGVSVLIDDAESINDLPADITRVAGDVLAVRADLLIAIGGDGSMLQAARKATRADTPLLGINRGRLGFLADVNPSDQIDPLDKILTGHYDHEQRMLLSTEIVSERGNHSCGLALNDVVVKRQDTGRMLEFNSFVDGGYVNTHGGDGFIVATPTGSTAYALSCGGPIVAPGLDAIVLAPICPHTLSDRPIVIPATSLVEICIGEGITDTAEVNCDGEVTGKISAGDRLQIAVAEQRLQLIHPQGYNYFEVLRNKLHWGRGKQDIRDKS